MVATATPARGFAVDSLLAQCGSDIEDEELCMNFHVLMLVASDLHRSISQA